MQRFAQHRHAIPLNHHPSLPTSLISLTLLLLFASLLFFSSFSFPTDLLHWKKSFLVTFIQSLEKRGCDRLGVLASLQHFFILRKTFDCWSSGRFWKNLIKNLTAREARCEVIRNDFLVKFDCDKGANKNKREVWFREFFSSPRSSSELMIMRREKHCAKERCATRWKAKTKRLSQNEFN